VHLGHAARDIEQAVLGHFKKNQLASNGAFISGVDPMLVAAKIGKVMRELIIGKRQPATP